MHVRTVDPLFVELADGKAKLSSPNAKRQIAVAPEILDLLSLAQCGADSETSFSSLGLSAQAKDAAVAQLVELDFLTVCSPEDSPRTNYAPWDAWGPVARTFHLFTRDVDYLSDPDAVREHVDRIAAAQPPRAAAALLARDVLLLPRVWSGLDGVTLKHVLETRRSHRTFQPRAAALDDVSTALHYAFSPIRFAECGALGVLELRSYASAGARYETCAYVVVFNIDGVAPGIYRYDQLRHGLVVTKPEPAREDWEQLTFGQGFFATAAFAVVLVARSQDMSWKYRHARAYRSMLQNAGHAAQVFAMAATGLGLGCAMTGAFRDSDIEAAVGCADDDEMALFLIACGTPVLSNGMPLDAEPPTSPWNPVTRHRE